MKQNSTNIVVFQILKYSLIAILMLVQHYPASAQKNRRNYVYQELIARAGLYHLQKNYAKAIPIYKQAFTLQIPDGLTCYKAAGAFALAGDMQQAVRYLQIAIDSAWTEADWLAGDSYFDKIASTSPDLWAQLKLNAYAAEARYAKTLSAPELRKTINLMMLTDQRLRYKRAQLTNKTEIDEVNGEIYQADKDNLEKAKIILSKHGWPKLSAVGKDGANNFWLIVQHADNDVLFQQLALKEMEKLKSTREINLENYAFLFDRVQCNLNYKQTYGTQVLWTSNGEASGFRPILREDLVDVRREKLGLLPLRIYALGYGFNYTNVQKYVAKSRDQNDVARAAKLTDSIALYYQKKQFAKAYAAADQAAMIAGGMNDDQNLQAAVLFAKMAADDTDPKYKGIALDFLNLLAMRRTLTKHSLATDAFDILEGESRWKEIEKLAI